MYIAGVTTPFSPNTAAEPKSSPLGKDDFLKLLMAQLGNQDPLSPMDNQAFVTQLAQFAQVEMAQTNAQQLDALLMTSASANQLQAASLVGKDAIYSGGSLDWSGAADGTPVGLSGEVGAGATDVIVNIKNEAGEVVRTMSLGALPQGPFTASWDGRGNSGNVMPAGKYTAEVVARDVQGKNVPAQGWTHSRIVGVSFDSGFTELILANHQRIKLADVMRVSEAT